MASARAAATARRRSSRRGDRDACGLLRRGDDSSGDSASAAGGEQAAKGGVLRLGSTADPGLDPQKDNYQLELFWCCLTRTLLTYNLRPVDEGGTKLVPDLATDLPEISDDGLTYTLKLRKGVHDDRPSRTARSPPRTSSAGSSAARTRQSPPRTPGRSP